MSCKCHKDKSGEFITPPNTICIFCAEKHLTALLPIWETPGMRAMKLGELNCARMHLSGGYRELAGDVRGLVEDVMLRQDAGLERITEICRRVSDLAATLPDGNDMRERKYTGPSSHIGYTGATYISELCLDTAWRLAAESGYADINRPMIVGNLVWAQICAEEFDKDMVMELRGLRHAFQTGMKLTDDPRLKKLQDKLEQASQGHEYRKGDFNWYLDI